ncbi:PQQ-binding-like beta-propeller repeat protein [Streptomyces sp. WMMC500]|uniref:PQQ-binding-like beta-propeller repeat protein n=1 Tax=Streptomyces sp. WMMC500 TaxID=3015154 RepID=UPI00248B7C7A|nr:PQQ-binding-like beta-propeller repeat protein [Streptomyces sp. WMMC500]WBB61751.1 PQQ-binding-like beta-propeller repeat protein [Streptomyces sp. WMMC500]
MSTRTNMSSRALAVAALLALAAACGGDGDGDERRTSRQPSEAPAASEEPPAATAFATDAAFSIETGPVRHPPVALHRQNAWVADETGLTMVDLATGKDVTRLKPERRPLHEAWQDPLGRPDEDEAAELEQQGAQRRLPRPLLARIGGTQAVVAAVPVRGQRQDLAVEILAANAETGERLWRLLVEPEVLADESAAKLSAPVLHAHDGKAVVQVAKDDRILGSLGVDLDEPKLVWEREDFLAMAGSGDELAGMSFRDGGGIRVLGAMLADGEPTWSEDSSKYASIAPCGPWLAFEDFEDEKGPRLVEVGSGEVTHTRDDGLVSGMSCWEGEGGTTVVLAASDESDGDDGSDKGGEERGGAIGLDTAGGKVLWQLPSEEWEGEVSASYEDRLYLKTGEGLAVRDARTGEVLGKAPGIAPQQVNGYAGLVAAGNGVDVHPADR